MDIETGNVKRVETQDTGWFLGYGDWAKSNIPGVTDLRYMSKETLSGAFCVKWMDHPDDDPNGSRKPKSEGRTISLLVSDGGRFRIEFSEDQQFRRNKTVSHMLENHGDYVIWGNGIYHRWFVDEACSILTIRWKPRLG